MTARPRVDSGSTFTDVVLDARREHDVVLDPDTFKVEAAATRALRARGR